MDIAQETYIVYSRLIRRTCLLGNGAWRRCMRLSVMLVGWLGIMQSCLCAGTVSAQAAAAADRLAWKVEYDSQDRATKSIDPAGRVTAYDYSPATNGLPRIITVTPPEGSPMTWRFATDGQLDAMQDGEGEVTYAYDKFGRLIAVERKGTPAIRYGYDSVGRLVDLRVGDFYRVEYIYDFLGRLESMKTPAGEVRYEYRTGAGEVVRTLPNGVKTIWKRQPNGELEEITHAIGKNPTDTQLKVLAQYTYTHGPDGRITTIRERSSQGEAVRQYKYDNMGRLTDATEVEGRAYHYEYDKVGNRTKATASDRPDQVCVYDWAGRLTSVDGKPCQYDACGNLREITLDGVTRKYRFHPDGRLAATQVDDENVEYRYDGFGRLVARKSRTGETRFIPNPLSPYWQPLSTDEPGSRRTLIVWDDVAPLALVRDGKVEWLLHDHLGSVRLVTDSKGEVAGHLAYDPFGVPVDVGRSSEMFEGFAGLSQDMEASGFHTLARFCVPELGCFLQPDPQLRLPGVSQHSHSLYAYCGGDPVNWVDVDGAEPEAVGVQPSSWSIAFGNLPYAGEMPPMYLQRTDDGTHRAWLISTLNRYEARLFPKTDLTSLTLAQRRKIRRDAVTQFAIDYSQDALGHKPKSPSDYVLHVANMNIATRSGLVNIDWMNTIIQKGTRSGPIELVTSLLPDSLRYYVGKWVNNTIVKPIGGGPRADPKNLYPAGDRNALRIVQNEIFNPDLPFARIFTPPTEPTKGIPPSPSQSGIEAPVEPKVPSRIDLRRLQDSKNLTDVISKQMDIARDAISRYDVSGGEGRVAGPGGFASPGGIAAAAQYHERVASMGGGVAPAQLAEHNAGGRYKAFEPSPVGGVYLGGSGGALHGLGLLKGVRVDDNGNLVLVGEVGWDVKLPPLRLDDVVTVFRSVFLQGEGPTVTIDPNPDDPEKSAMIIRHGKATEDTYVGWVLYQADRLMKGYGQGVDNISTNEIVSRAPGYSNVLETVYFGGEDPRKRQKEGIWERFWIVPAAVSRFQGPRAELTLMDVPLKVKTQKMKWKKDKLVDDLSGRSSPGALAFTSWFTSNYDAIAAEQYLTPPSESGITNAVPVFTELRRIALITAIAEQLRDQGAPMPFWMRDYDVRKVPFERFTPGLEVTRKRAEGNMIRIARIFGGVELSPPSKEVRTYTAATDTAKLSPDLRAEVDRSVTLAAHLEKAIARAVSPTAEAPLTVHRVDVDGRACMAATIPGADTLALGPCQMEEADLVVTTPGGGDIRLARSFNSFFDPGGPWGRGWALDLPRLQEVVVSEDRKGKDRIGYVGFELCTPLNRIYARFLGGTPVENFAHPAATLVDVNSPFRGIGKDKPAFLKDVETRVVGLKNGAEWSFTTNGDLVAVQEGPQTTVYERGTDGSGHADSGPVRREQWRRASLWNMTTPGG